MVNLRQGEALGGLHRNCQTATELVPTDANNWAHLAYSTRQAKAGGLEEAVKILTGAVDSFPKNPMICYYLACYTAQQKALIKTLAGPIGRDDPSIALLVFLF